MAIPEDNELAVVKKPAERSQFHLDGNHFHWTLIFVDRYLLLISKILMRCSCFNARRNLTPIVVLRHLCPKILYFSEIFQVSLGMPIQVFGGDLMRKVVM